MAANPDSIDLDVRQLQCPSHGDDDRRDQGGRFAAVVGERGNDSRQGGDRRLTGLAPMSIARSAGGEIGARGTRAVVARFGEDVRLVRSERLAEYIRRVGIPDQRLHAQLGPSPPTRPIEIVTVSVGLPSTAKARAPRASGAFRPGRAFLDVCLGQNEQ